MKSIRMTLTGATLMLAAVTATSPVLAAEEVNVYSYRQPYLVEPLFKAFTEATGIKVNVIFAEKGLAERMAQEGSNSPADVLMAVDVARLTDAVNMGITQPVESAVLTQAIPAAYRDKDNNWFGLTTRARVVYASKERVAQDAITYEELADPKWKGRICIRSGQHPYNISLFASMIAHHGEDWTKEWLKGVKANLARKPASNDRAQVKGVYSGECDIAVGNTYYMAKMMLNNEEPEQKEWAASVRMLFPNTDDRGTHVNISGIVLAKNAPHRDAAVKFIEFLASDKAQEIYAEVNDEYPVKPGVPWSDLVKSWGTFKADDLPLTEVAKYRKRASELVDEVAFDDGPGS